jgi:hypothetical protein
MEVEGTGGGKVRNKNKNKSGTAPLKLQSRFAVNGSNPFVKKKDAMSVRYLQFSVQLG